LSVSFFGTFSQQVYKTHVFWSDESVSSCDIFSMNPFVNLRRERRCTWLSSFE